MFPVFPSSDLFSLSPFILETQSSITHSQIPFQVLIRLRSTRTHTHSLSLNVSVFDLDLSHFYPLRIVVGIFTLC
ncbi:hypothetical protein BDQ12DRAFT_692506 [Crucibulum laeve]|uniref:Uncharacterized protein n=1 Tax=Crucibulum laeve TaxID=68775 RepID=A0A5C3LH64_9AGAR|nr:hypothetical protein BDQ12DRAFT_692506 [Crucibulum laeve]